jgi:3-oxoacyl-(acyl-carrier-protein) synthase
MTDSLVIVGVSRIDSDTEKSTVTANDSGIWTFNLPQNIGQMAEQAIQSLDIKVLENVETVITCSSADDSYARYSSVINKRARPRDVLSALGVNLSIILNDHLPNVQNIFKIEAACATGLVALDLANMMVRAQNSVVLIAGVDKSTAPNFLNLFHYIGAVATLPGQYYSPFDQRRAGFAMGEGAGMVAVTTSSQARARGLDVLAVVDSVKTQTILTHPTLPTDSVLLEQFIRQTIAKSGRSLQEFACWDAHAASTPSGDHTEYQIFANIFKNNTALISSFKSQIGHCMSTSALLETVNAIQNLQLHKVSPNFKLDQPIVNDPRLITHHTDTQQKTFIKTSFGFGGKNAAAVITVQ